MVASSAFSEPKHLFNCFQNKSEKQSKSFALVQDYCKIGIIPMIGTHQLVYKDLTRVRHVFIAFSRFKTLFFLDIQKLQYAAANFAHTQARPCSITS